MKVDAKKIELLMAEKGLLSKDVAERSGMSRQNFSTVKLRGSCTPVNAGKIAKALGVDVTEILAKEKE